MVFDIDSSDGSIWRYSYSRRWLEDTTDNPSILNNFQHLFEFTDHQVLLTLPSYTAALGVMERVMGLTGVAEYKVGLHFQAVDARSLLQTLMLHNFLQAKGMDLEKVISWFFEEYLVEEFGITKFTFTPSGKDVPYLQKVRHLFAEMESVANQFGLYAENGELDRELLSMGSAQVQFKKIPSLLKGKYVYATENSEAARVLNLLFSDQSPLLYINEGLQGDDAVALLLENRLAREDFHRYQVGDIDFLIDQGILKNDGEYVTFADLGQLVVFRSLYSTDAANYHHLSDSQRAHVDVMVAKGWAVRRSSLLTASEGDYFNFFLNRVGFSNGLNLRNSYLHGLQENGDGDDGVHFNTYLIALRLTIALVIKMNDDICLSMSTEATGGSGGETVGYGAGDSH
ncbi:hypothetical protein BIU90_15745 [Curtobacterium sp. MCBA15_001]|nr:hypothetical protein BIU90_15745 [Curtobacterium sp. MCBA15_001]